MDLFDNNFDDFMRNFHEMGSFHNMRNLGEPTSVEKIERGGVIYEIKIWKTPNGQIKTMDVIGISDDPEDVDFTSIKDEMEFTDDELGSVFDNPNAIPMGFLRLLSDAANFNEFGPMGGMPRPQTRKLTKEEQISMLEEDLAIAVQNEDYEGAALIRDDIDELKNS